MRSLIVVALLGVASPAFAQKVVHPGDPAAMTWDYDGPDIPTVAGYCYKLYEGPTLVLPSIADVKCIQQWTNLPNTFTCSAPIPVPPVAFGVHTFKVTVIVPGRTESGVSQALTVDMEPAQSEPVRNLR